MPVFWKIEFVELRFENIVFPVVFNKGWPNKFFGFSSFFYSTTVAGLENKLKGVLDGFDFTSKESAVSLLILFPLLSELLKKFIFLEMFDGIA